MTHPREQEQNLIARSIAGDGRAFEKLIKPHANNIKRQVSSFYRTPQDAEDAYQDALLAIFNGLASFRGDSKFSVWCYAVAANAARAIYNKNKKICRVSYLVDNDESGSVDEDNINDRFETARGCAPSAEDEVSAMQTARSISNAFSLLTDEQRDALYLREIEQLSYEEIAERLDCPVGSVKSRLHRARQVIESAV